MGEALKAMQIVTNEKRLKPEPLLYSLESASQPSNKKPEQSTRRLQSMWEGEGEGEGGGGVRGFESKSAVKMNGDVFRDPLRIELDVYN